MILTFVISTTCCLPQHDSTLTIFVRRKLTTRPLRSSSGTDDVLNVNVYEASMFGGLRFRAPSLNSSQC